MNGFFSDPSVTEIRYIRLHFYIRAAETKHWPINKVSAFRGGMGESLLRMHCVQHRHCETCSFREECLVQRMMYSHMKIQPPFMSRGDSMGYVLECTDYRELLREGDQMDFCLILIGSNISYFSLYLQAFQYLGLTGVGKEHAQYEITRVTDSTGKVIMENNDVLVADLPFQTLRQYLEHSDRIGSDRMRILLRTPLSIKYHGTFLTKVTAEALMESASRRLFMLDCFEGISAEACPVTDHLPEIVNQDISIQKIKRYSSTHDERIALSGMVGHIDLEHVDETARTLLRIGELMHLGKNTSFGFGQYRILNKISYNNSCQ